jgi:hypothetical protein
LATANHQYRSSGAAGTRIFRSAMRFSTLAASSTACQQAIIRRDETAETTNLVKESTKADKKIPKFLIYFKTLTVF